LQCKIEQQQIYYKKRLIKFFGLYRLMPIQKHLKHSIMSNEVKGVLFCGHFWKKEKYIKSFYALNFENFQIKKNEGYNCLLEHSHLWDWQLSISYKSY